MRHIYGIALAIVVSLVMFFAGAWGYLRLLRLPGTLPPANGGSLLSSGSVLAAFAAVGAVGLLAGILLATPWVSPLATGLPGIALLAWTGLYLVSVSRAVRLIPLRTHAFGAGWEALLFNGVLGGVGLLMIAPMFVPSRWRRFEMEEDEEPEIPGAESAEPTTSRPPWSASAPPRAESAPPSPGPRPRRQDARSRPGAEGKSVAGPGRRVRGPAPRSQNRKTA
jgi:hypothetical protein